MTIKCARCKADNEVDEGTKGTDQNNLLCLSCFAPLSEAFQVALAETIAHNEQEIEKLKWREQK
jgi:hypothetical protein